MKKLIQILLLLLPLFIFGQTPRVFTGKCNISQTGSGSGYWTVAISQFNDPLGLYDASEIQVNDKLLFNDGGIEYVLNITLVSSAVGNSATVRVSNVGITGISSVPTFTGASITRGTANYGFVPFVANISDNNQQGNQEYNMYRVDSILAIKDSANVIPLSEPISFGGVVTDTLQEALKAIDARLDSAFVGSLQSQFINNDSVFVVTPTDTIFTGLADITSSFGTVGRIWYVSTFGNNNNCFVGKPDKPCRDMWAARDSAQSGDIIYVQPGTWDIGTIGSGAYKEVGNTTDTSVNLFFNGSYYFSPGAKIITKFSSTANTKLFNATNWRNSQYNFTITGDGEIISDTLFENYPTIFYDTINVNYPSVRVNLRRADGALYTVGLSGTGTTNSTFVWYIDRATIHGQSNYKGDCRVGELRIKYVDDRSNTTTFLGYFKTGVFRFNIDNWERRRRLINGNGGFDNNGFYYPRTQIFAGRGGTFYFHTGSFLLDVKGENIYKCKFHNLPNYELANGFVNTDSSYAEYTTGHLIDNDTTYNVPYFQIQNSQNITQGSFNVEFGRVESKKGILFDTDNSAGSFSRNWTIRCDDCHFYGAATGSAIIRLRAGGANETFNITGNYYNRGDNCLYIDNGGVAGTVWVNNARLESSGARAPIRCDITNKLFIKNAVLVNNGSYATIESVTASTSVGIMGVYSNSTIVDADVTEAIEPIIRNTNVK